MANRTHSPLSVAVTDLDAFKVVDDTTGHAAGDQVLVETAVRWRQALRQIDVLVRHGGDEFVVLLPSCDLQGATEVCERMRSLGSHECSAGVTEWVPGEDVDAVLARADRALYQAKETGRNRVASLRREDNP